MCRSSLSMIAYGPTAARTASIRSRCSAENGRPRRWTRNSGTASSWPAHQLARAAVGELVVDGAAEQERDADALLDGALERLRVAELEHDATPPDAGELEQPVDDRRRIEPLGDSAKGRRSSASTPIRGPAGATARLLGPEELFAPETLEAYAI